MTNRCHLHRQFSNFRAVLLFQLHDRLLDPLNVVVGGTVVGRVVLLNLTWYITLESKLQQGTHWQRHRRLAKYAENEQTVENISNNPVQKRFVSIATQLDRRHSVVVGFDLIRVHTLVRVCTSNQQLFRLDFVVRGSDLSVLSGSTLVFIQNGGHF